MGFIVSSVAKGGLGADMGLRPGDELLKINGERVIDLIDYQQLQSCDNIVLTIRTPDGDVQEIEADKDEDEVLDVEFTKDLLGPVRCCANRCEFCFVDQLPKNMRSSLYVKDDDWRMSLMMGNYVTLTNVTPTELKRIIRRHASPLYLSIHATDPELRGRIMGTPRAALLMEQLRELQKGGISFHGQVVVCPGLNDGDALRKTVYDMAAMYPCALTLALVPVGLTRHRDGLTALHPYDAESAGRLLDELEKWQAGFRDKLGTSFVFAADEFYVMAGRDVPDEAHYEGYPQIDNGVGLIRQQRDAFAAAYNEFVEGGGVPRARKVLIATGVSAEGEMRRIAETWPLPGVEVEVRAIRNTFFGESVTVSGLITGGDLMRQLEGVKADELLIPRTMLRDGGNVFLDDVPLDELQAKLGMPIRTVWTDGDDLLRALAGLDENI